MNPRMTEDQLAQALVDMDIAERSGGGSICGLVRQLVAEVRVLTADYNDMKEDRDYLMSILRPIAYPRRGTKEESMTIQDVANQLLALFTPEQLGVER